MKRNTTILVIDDEENYLFIIKELLAEEGYTVTTCNDASLALLLLEKEQYDIVITDVKMPKCSGKDIVEYVHSTYPDTPIIVITAFGSIENAISFMKGGVFHYVTKPFENEELLHIVHNASELAFARKQYKKLYNRIHNAYDEQYPLISHSKSMKRVVDFIDTIQEQEVNILIEGEHGVGKKYVAHHIHNLCSTAPLHIIDIEGKSEDNLEALLLGEQGILHEYNASVILDCIDAMPYGIQIKLLQYISDKERKGERVPRIFALSVPLLEERVISGHFHSDLYYLLAVLRIELPSLRERREDIPSLAVALMKEINADENIEAKRLGNDILHHLTHYEWRGNVTELKTVLRRMAITAQNAELTIHDLPIELQEDRMRFTSAVDLLPISLNLADTLEKIEEQLIRRALVHCNFIQARAAALLGISKSRLQYKLMKYEIAGHHLHY